ncbi:MAG: hypothetical protein ABSG64_06545 [Solirubrobacteraceae bacterium]
MACLLAPAVAALSLALAAAPAQAKNLYTLDPNADSTGPIVVDSAGNGYVSWLRTGSPDQVMFCKIPVNGRCTAPATLPLPSGVNINQYGTSQPYPVLAGNNQVWVIAPSYVVGDIVYWLSTDGGTSFGAPVNVTAANDYADETSVDDVLLEPDEPYLSDSPPVAYFDIASSNPGVGYSWLPSNLVPGGSEATAFQFANPGSGGVGGATLGEQPDGFPLEAYWNDSTPSQIFYFHQTQQNGSVAALPDAWTSTPTLLANGYLPQLAGGPKGLFIAYEAYHGGSSSTPSQLIVRSYDQTSGTFGAPKTLVTDPQTDTALSDGGTINENAATGHLAVVWPDFLPGGTVMRLWTSDDAGAKFTYVGKIAKVASAYSGSTNLALNAKGGGFVTFQDSAGLQVANLTLLKKAKKNHHGPLARSLLSVL